MIFMLSMLQLLGVAASAQNTDLITKADSSFAAGDYAQLLVDCDAAIVEFPDSAFLYYYRGVAAFAFGENAAAKADFDKAIELESGYAEAYVARARLYYAMGERESAYKDVRACLSVTQPCSRPIFFAPKCTWTRRFSPRLGRIWRMPSGSRRAIPSCIACARSIF
ncbi:MAG: hypothetical protein IPP17_27485 [Bacteroidetes bacterium]|nr:hypothetical protein [Bacteroidota bacterium]